MPKVDSPHSTIYYPDKKKSIVMPTVSPENVVWKTPGSSLAKSYPLAQWNKNWEDARKQLHPYYGSVGATYYANTGMPWLASDARKAVLTEWFWQPIRGQPRRIDTNELRKYANTVWVQSIVMTILNQISSFDWDIIPKEDGQYDEAIEEEIKRVKNFFENPNKNKQSIEDVLRTWIKDVLEIDAGVLVKVFTIDSYDFEHLEPRSGAPLLKPLICPECNGIGSGSQKSFKIKASATIDSIAKAVDLPEEFEVKGEGDNVKTYKVLKPDYESTKNKMLEIVSYNSPSDANVLMPCPFCNGTGSGRKLTELYAYDGASFLADADRTGWVYGYWQYSYAIPAHPMWFNRDEIIYFKNNPRSMSVYGFSAVQSSLETIKALEYSVKHNMALFIDGAVPDGVVSVEDMDDAELTRMKTTWENDLKGQPHKVVFLNKKTTFSPFAFNNRDMQFLEGQMSAWKQVIANFNLAPVDLGITDDLNRATAGNQAEQSRRKAIRPLLKKMERLINKNVLPELQAFDTKFSFIINDPVEERMKADLYEVQTRIGYKSIDEIRLENGLPPLPSESVLSPFENDLRTSFDVKPTGEGGKPSETRGIDDMQSERENSSDDVTEKKKLSKDYQYPIQPQESFITTVQNLSTPHPYALPKQGHVNTQYPYDKMNMSSIVCPGCGYTTLSPVEGMVGSAAAEEKNYECSRCNRNYTENDLAQAILAQQQMNERKSRGDPLAPKVVADTQTTGERIHTHKNVELDLLKEVKNVTIEEWLGFKHAPILEYIKKFIESYKFEYLKASDSVKSRIKKIFEEAFTKGLNLHQLSKKLINLGFSESESVTMARTETIRFANEGKLMQAEESDFKKVIFTATTDSRTCEICTGLNGKEFYIRKAKGVIPGQTHDRCRCTWRVKV